MRAESVQYLHVLGTVPKGTRCSSAKYPWPQEKLAS